MSESDQRTLERLAYKAWLRRGRPFGSPEVDWEEACRAAREEEQDDSPSAPPGGIPTDLGAVPPPELSHDQKGIAQRMQTAQSGR